MTVVHTISSSIKLFYSSLKTMVCTENIVFYAGVIYLLKLAVFWLWNVHDGLKAYVYPKIFSIDYKQKYGEWAVITGCTQGIGKCYAEEMAKKGLNVVLVSRTKSKLDNLASDLSRKYGTCSINFILMIMLYYIYNDFKL